jgi:hypothetical protein
MKIVIIEYSSEGKVIANMGNQIIKTGYEIHITLDDSRIR